MVFAQQQINLRMCQKRQFMFLYIIRTSIYISNIRGKCGLYTVKDGSVVVRLSVCLHRNWVSCLKKPEFSDGVCWSAPQI